MRALACIVGLGLVLACSTETPPPKSFGKISVRLVDAPPEGAIEAVIVTISRVDVVPCAPDAVPITVSEEVQTFDLLALREAAIPALLGNATVPDGAYCQVRLLVTDASVIINGVEEELVVPTGAIKIAGEFEIVEGKVTILVLDFDARESIVDAGPRFHLKPVIRIAAAFFEEDRPPRAAVTVPEQGAVTTDETTPVAVAVEDPEATVEIDGVVALQDPAHPTIRTVSAVPLRQGENLIEVVATSTTGNVARTTLTVFRLKPGADEDGDGVANSADNCIFTDNVDQTDSEESGQGDACRYPVFATEIKAAPGGRVAIDQPGARGFGTSLEIPAHALDQTRTVVLQSVSFGEEVTGLLPGRFVAISTPVLVQPSGISFSVAATIRIPFSPLEVMRANQRALQAVVFSIDPVARTAEQLPVQQIDEASATIEASMVHASIIVAGLQLSDAPEAVADTGTGTSRFPAMYGRYIVWEELRTGNLEIFLYNFNLGAAGGPVNITNNAEPQRSPQIFGNYVVWEDFRPGVTDPLNPSDIFLYHLPTGTTTPITRPGRQITPDIYGTRIVFQDFPDGGNIIVFDFRSGVTTQLTNTAAPRQRPRIHGNRVVWEQGDVGSRDIYYYDLADPGQPVNGTQLTTDPGDQHFASIYGDRVIWTDERFATPMLDNSELFLFDFTVGTEQRLTNNAERDEFIDIYGDFVALSRRPDGVLGAPGSNLNFDVYVIDLATSSEVPIATGPFLEAFPAIYGNRVAWIDQTARGPDGLLTFSNSGNLFARTIERPILATDVGFGHFPFDRQVADGFGQGRSLTGTMKPLSVVVNFPDYDPFSSTTTDFICPGGSLQLGWFARRGPSYVPVSTDAIRALLYSHGQVATGSTADYWNEASYGTLQVEGTVVEPTPPQLVGGSMVRPPAFAPVGNLCGYPSLGGAAEQELFLDAIAGVDADVDFRQFDGDGDNYVDGLVTIFEGQVVLPGGHSQPFWLGSNASGTRAFFGNGDGLHLRGGVYYPEFDFALAAQRPIGLLTHEWAHFLGTRDLYVIPGFTPVGSGEWSTSSAGGTFEDSNLRGSGPTLPFGYERRTHFGWLTPIEIAVSGHYQLVDINQLEGPRLYKFPIRPDAGSVGMAPLEDYFLFEHRSILAPTKFIRRGTFTNFNPMVYPSDFLTRDGSGYHDSGLLAAQVNEGFFASPMRTAGFLLQLQDANPSVPNLYDAPFVLDDGPAQSCFVFDNPFTTARSFVVTNVRFEDVSFLGAGGPTTVPAGLGLGFDLVLKDQIVVLPAESSVGPIGQVQFSTSVPGAVWSVNGIVGGNAATVGTITTSGLYTTPTSVTMAFDVVIRAEAPCAAATALLHVVP